MKKLLLALLFLSAFINANAQQVIAGKVGIFKDSVKIGSAVINDNNILLKKDTVKTLSTHLYSRDIVRRIIPGSKLSSSLSLDTSYLASSRKQVFQIGLGNNQSVPNWNTLETSTSSLTDTDGVTELIGLNITGQHVGYSDYAVTFDSRYIPNSGIYPDAILSRHVYWLDTAFLQLTGLKNRLYNITFFSGVADSLSDGMGDYYTLDGAPYVFYKIGEKTDSLYETFNYQNTVTFYNIEPDVTGQINVKLWATNSSEHGINAIILSTSKDSSAIKDVYINNTLSWQRNDNDRIDFNSIDPLMTYTGYPLMRIDGSRELATFGSNAGHNTAIDSAYPKGYGNTAIGHTAMSANIQGYALTAIGANSMVDYAGYHDINSLNAGHDMTFVGYNSARGIIRGGNCVGVGNEVGFGHLFDNNSTYIGSGSGYNATPIDSVADNTYVGAATYGNNSLRTIRIGTNAGSVETVATRDVIELGNYQGSIPGHDTLINSTLIGDTITTSLDSIVALGASQNVIIGEDTSYTWFGIPIRSGYSKNTGERLQVNGDVRINGNLKISTSPATGGANDSALVRASDGSIKQVAPPVIPYSEIINYRLNIVKAFNDSSLLYRTQADHFIITSILVKCTNTGTPLGISVGNNSVTNANNIVALDTLPGTAGQIVQLPLISPMVETDALTWITMSTHSGAGGGAEYDVYIKGYYLKQ